MRLPLLLLLAACTGVEKSDPCFTFAPDPWDPVLEPDVRADESTAAWEAVGDATIDPASSDCGAPPCLAVTGPGGATLPLQLNRGVPHTVTGTLTTDTPVTLVVSHTSSDGSVRTLVESSYEAGVHAIDLAFVVESAGAEGAVTLTLEEAGTATFDALQVLGERWAASADAPGGAVRLGFLVHVEDDPKLLDDEALWRRRARVLEGLSATLGAHGARLGIQADSTFIRATSQWDPAWFAAREAEGAGWSVHIHDEGSALEVEQAIRDGKVALREAGALTTDLNGGFGAAPWVEARLAGITSLTAFKDPATQRGLPRVQVQPWRVGDGVGTADPDAFLAHDPDGPLLYLPGHDIREVEHARFPTAAAQTLSQVLAHARPDHVNAWYWVLHVDGFGPSTDHEAELDAYLDGAGFAADLAAYDAFLADTTDPLVTEGLVVYDTPVGMATAWKDWNAACEDTSVQ